MSSEMNAASMSFRWMWRIEKGWIRRQIFSPVCCIQTLLWFGTIKVQITWVSTLPWKHPAGHPTPASTPAKVIVRHSSPQTFITWDIHQTFITPYLKSDVHHRVMNVGQSAKVSHLVRPPFLKTYSLSANCSTFHNQYHIAMQYHCHWPI